MRRSRWISWPYLSFFVSLLPSALAIWFIDVSLTWWIAIAVLLFSAVGMTLPHVFARASWRLWERFLLVVLILLVLGYVLWVPLGMFASHGGIAVVYAMYLYLAVLFVPTNLFLATVYHKQKKP